MLLGYCIRRRTDPAPAKELRGVDAGPVGAVEHGELSIWVSAGSVGPATVERLHAHERVVRAALRSATPLPLRFGTYFTDEDEVGELLATRGDEFLLALQRLEGLVEMSVRIAFPDDAPAPDPIPELREPPGGGAAKGSGRAFLERRRRDIETGAAAQAARDDLLASLEAELAHLDLPSARSVLTQQPFVGGLAHLVHRERLPWYRERIVELQKKRPDLQITVTGPWAPYSFIS